MVTNVTSLTGNGLRDWLIQRATAILLALYTFFLAGFFVMHPQVQHADWQSLFGNLWMQIFSSLALLSLVLHAYVGVWTVLTDYVKCSVMRLTLMFILVFALIGFLIWGTVILWSL